jgi:hypothetical protein
MDDSTLREKAREALRSSSRVYAPDRAALLEGYASPKAELEIERRVQVTAPGDQPCTARARHRSVGPESDSGTPADDSRMASLSA